MKHLSDQELSAYLDGALTGRPAEEAARHLAACAPCREALEELAARDEALRPALGHEPGEAYFEDFAARVQDRLAAGGRAASRPHPRPPPGGWFSSPRALAWAGGVAVVVVAGGLALLLSRDTVPPDLRDEALRAPVESASPEAGPPAPAAGEGAFPGTPGAPAPGGRGAADLPAPVPEPVRASPGAPDGGPPTAGAMGQDEAALEPAVPRPAPAGGARRAERVGPSGAGPAADDARRVVPGRALEVRRNEAGEEVPVRRQDLPRVAQPPAPSAPGDQTERIRKRLAAEPLDRAKMDASGARPKEGATPAPAAPHEGPAAPPAGSREAGTPGGGRLCGEVRDDAGRAVAGAQVALAESGRSAATDSEGRFCLEAPPGEHTLSVMAVGYRETRRTVRAGSAGKDVRVTLRAVPVLEGGGLTAARRIPAPGAPPPAPAGPGDPFAALSDTVARLVREARRLEGLAVERGSAAHYDLAAGAWQRVLRQIGGGPLEIETRRHVAEARYRAWEMAPNSRRGLAAIEALTAYVTRAPAGPERDEAARRLNEVRP